MKTLIVEDEFASRMILHENMRVYGPCHVAVNGREAVEAFQKALEADEPYDLVCLDIMMPEMDGHEALKKIRGLEESRGIRSTDGVRIMMTTALNDPKNVVEAFKGLCDAYLVKPVTGAKLSTELKKMGFLSE